MSHKVTAPYVTVRVPNDIGQDVLKGYYAGAVLPENANEEDLARLVRKEMVVDEGKADSKPASTPAKPAARNSREA